MLSTTLVASSGYFSKLFLTRCKRICLEGGAPVVYAPHARIKESMGTIDYLHNMRNPSGPMAPPLTLVSAALLRPCSWWNMSDGVSRRRWGILIRDEDCDLPSFPLLVSPRVVSTFTCSSRQVYEPPIRCRGRPIAAPCPLRLILACVARRLVAVVGVGKSEPDHKPVGGICLKRYALSGWVRWRSRLGERERRVMNGSLV